jgi:hypothetical protein
VPLPKVATLCARAAAVVRESRSGRGICGTDHNVMCHTSQSQIGGFVITKRLGRIEGDTAKIIVPGAIHNKSQPVCQVRHFGRMSDFGYGRGLPRAFQNPNPQRILLKPRLAIRNGVQHAVA